MNKKAEQFCAWSGVAFMLLFGIGWLVFAPAFFPPHPPGADVSEILARYSSNTNLLRFGLILIIVSAGFFALYSAALANLLYRHVAPQSPLLAIGQILGGGVNTIFFILPPVLWGVAAFRLDRNPEIIQAINDIGWFFFFQPASLILVQFLTLAYGILNDKSTQPALPRWVAFLNMWMAAIFVPAYMLTFFKTGPFAWNGVFCFWLPVASFAPWVGVHVYYMLKAAGRFEGE